MSSGSRSSWYTFRRLWRSSPFRCCSRCCSEFFSRFSWIRVKRQSGRSTSQTIPTTALAPLFVLWLGYGIWSKVLAAVLMTFFPIAVTLSDGFRAIPPEMTELMQTLGATRWQLFWKLKLPAVLPSFFTAIRMAIPLSVIGAAIGEWLGAQAGLGYFSRRMMTQLDGAGVFAPIVLLSVAAMLLTALARQIETRALRFRNHQDSDREETRRRDS